MSERQEAAENFIGRDKEIRLYQEWLANPASPWILYFHDALTEPGKKGGIGKTWLLRRCISLTRELHQDIAIVGIDFFNIDDRQGIIIAQQVLEKLHETFPHWSPETSLELFQGYSGNVEEITDSSAFRSQLSAALTADLRALEDLLQRDGRYLLLFFDTFELIEKNPIIASLDLTHVFPDNYQSQHIGAVIAGRNAIDWKQKNWLGREKEVKSVAIAPFSLEEMVLYLNSRSLDVLKTDARETMALYERTEGRPILIGLVTDILIYQATNLDELLSIPPATFEARLVAKINDLANPTNWIILFMAHAYHRFNTTLLDWILQEAHLQILVQSEQDQQTMENLLTLSFVRRSTTGNDFVLHDEMRRLVLKHCWNIQDPDLRYRHEISRSAIRYYEHELTKTTKNDPLVQTYTIEMLYHKLYLDLNGGLAEMERLFSEALALWMPTYARSLLQEVQLFLERMTTEQYYRLLLLEAQLLKEEDNPQAALQLYEKLQKEADQSWQETYRAELLYGLGDCYLDLSRFPEAIECFAESQNLEKARGNVARSADILGLLGYIYRRQGEWEKAVQHYLQSLEGYKSLNDRREYANMLNSLGYVYRLQGQIEEALRRCKSSLRIRQDLFREGKAAEVSIGLSHGTLGLIYLKIRDTTQAEEHFKQALEIYRRAGYKRGEILLYNRFGQLEFTRGNLEAASVWFQKVEDSLIGIDFELQTINLIRQGLLFIRQGNYKEAIARFEQAIVLSHKTRDYYQESEALIECARALNLAGDSIRSQQQLERGVAIAQDHRYFSLLGNSEYLLGEVELVREDYIAAFEHYARASHYLAQYNALRFNTALRKLNDMLLDIPGEALPAVLAFLRSYWSSQGLNTLYPEFLQVCDAVEELITDI